MSTFNDDDKFLIQRGTDSYKLNAVDLMSTINDDDLLLVQRGQDSYKVTGLDVKEQLSGPTGYFDTPVEVLTPLNGAGLNGGQPYEPTSTAITGESGGVITFTDNTELENIIGPVQMVDANGAVKTPVSSAITGTSTITGDAYFTTTLYNGLGYNSAEVTGVDNTDTAMIWIKARNASDEPAIFDTERGIYKHVKTSDNSVQVTSNQTVQSFNDDGVDLGNNPVVNNNGFTYAAWNFKAAPGFFDVVKFTGVSSVQQVPHSIGSPPGFIIYKKLSTNQTSSIPAWHVEAPTDAGSGRIKVGFLDQNQPFDDYALFGDTTPASQTATELQISNIEPGNDYVAWAFGNDGVNIKCGSYVGASNGNEQNCGFKPGWLMIRNVQSGQNGNWLVFDSERGLDQGGIDNPSDANAIAVDLTSNDGAYKNRITSTDTGFKFHTQETPGNVNSVGASYIYVAIREGAGEPDTTELSLTDSTDLEFLREGDVTSTAVEIKSIDTVANKLTVDYGSPTLDKVVGKSNPYGISYHNGVYVLSTSDTIYRSTTFDGTWSQVYTGTDLHSTYSNGYFIAVDNKRLIYSTDGSSWTNGPFTVTNIVKGISTFSTSTKDYVAVCASNSQVFYLEVVSGQNPNSWTNLGNYTYGGWGQFSAVDMFAVTCDLSRNKIIIVGEFGKIAETSIGSLAGWTDKGLSVSGSNTMSSVVYVPDPAGGYVLSALSGKKIIITSASSAAEVSDPSLGGTPKLGDFDGVIWIASGTDIYKVPYGDIRYSNIPPATYSAADDIRRLNPNGELLLMASNSYAYKETPASTPYQVGETVTGPTLNTVSNNVTAQSGSTLTVSDTTGDWRAGLFAEGATITRAGPSPSSIVFTSQNNNTTPVTGLDATLARRVWTLESSNSASGPWTLVGTYSDNAANASQDGAAPWANPSLTPNTFYQVKVKYESDNADAVESIYNTFRAGEA